MATLESSASPSTGLNEGPLGRALLGLVGPMFVGMALIGSVGIVDTYFVGELGTDPLAALGLSYPFVAVIQASMFGFTASITALVGMAHASGAPVRRLIALGMASLGAFSTTIAGVMLFAHGAVFRALGGSEAVAALASDYFTPLLVAIVVLTVPMGVTGSLRGLGETRSTASVMLSASVVNAVLDPLLIHGVGPFPALGIAGAAWSTVVANCVATLIALALLRRRLAGVPILREITAAADLLRALLALGLPALLAQALGPFAAGVEAALVARHGTSALAGLGIIQRVAGLVMMMAFATSTALMPLVAQCWGAGARPRAVDAVALARRGIIVYGVLAWLVLGLAGAALGARFTDDPAVVALVGAGFWVFGTRFFTTGSVVVAIGAFNAVGRARRAPQLTGLYCFVLLPVLGAVGGRLYGAIGVLGGGAFGALGLSILAAHWLERDGLSASSSASG